MVQVSNDLSEVQMDPTSQGPSLGNGNEDIPEAQTDLVSQYSTSADAVDELSEVKVGAVIPEQVADVAGYGEQRTSKVSEVAIEGAKDPLIEGQDQKCAEQGFFVVVVVVLYCLCLGSNIKLLFGFNVIPVCSLVRPNLGIIKVSIVFFIGFSVIYFKLPSHRT